MSQEAQVQQGPVADMSPIEKEILHAIVATADGWIACIATDFDLPIITVDRDQRLGDFSPEECFNPRRPTLGDWQVVDLFVIVGEYKVNVRVGKSKPCKRLNNVAAFGLSRF